MQKLLIIIIGNVSGIILLAGFLFLLPVLFIQAMDTEEKQAAECSGIVGYERVECENILRGGD